MRVSGLLITHQLTDEAMGWFSALRETVDELVAFVDQDHAAPDLDAKLRRLDARIFATRGPELQRADFPAMVRACRGDWILKIDYDEELSPEWSDPRWRGILDAGEFTHFWLPRRWTTAPGEFIASEPWWPDRQLRLFRNRLADITFPTRLHDNLSVKGAGGYLRTLAIHHHDLRLASRPAREAKADIYEQRSPGKGLGFFYLPEDFDLRRLPLPPASEFDLTREILQMGQLDDTEAALLVLKAATPPARMASRELLWLDVRLTNGTGRAVCSGAPFPVNLACHWLDAATSNPIVFDGERTAILPEVPSGQTADFKMFIIAPEEPGEYLLRVTLVQEQARWLDSGEFPTVQDFNVRVE